MAAIYVAPSLEVLGSVGELTLAGFPGPNGTTKILGGDLDGYKLKIGNQKFPLGYS